MKTRRYVPVLIALALGLAAPGYAGNGTGGAKQGGGVGQRAAQPGMAHRRSPAEIAKVFRQMDGNGDGVVTRAEYMAMRMGGGSGRNAARMEANQTGKAARFSTMDADGSGTLTLGEFGAVSP